MVLIKLIYSVVISSCINSANTQSTFALETTPVDLTTTVSSLSSAGDIRISFHPDTSSDPTTSQQPLAKTPWDTILSMPCIIPIAAGWGLVVILIVILVICVRKRQKENAMYKAELRHDLQKTPRLESYDKLKSGHYSNDFLEDTSRGYSEVKEFKMARDLRTEYETVNEVLSNNAACCAPVSSNDKLDCQHYVNTYSKETTHGYTNVTKFRMNVKH
ncbi:hypothetical protein DPMN_054554 [Dreissena polymorpha]|uniref:Uncharacterized protein n=1 Tax=Dreissena polymorpha TaxID=45954 RepID=A0A9D4CPP4_DREPO|nr:hypothetical protein DPMN_054554 [Dreissena polymorpha]